MNFRIGICVKGQHRLPRIHDEHASDASAASESRNWTCRIGSAQAHRARTGGKANADRLVDSLRSNPLAPAAD